MANITHKMTLSTTEPNNNIGLLKIRQADEETQTLAVEITENGLPKSYEGFQVFFCAKLGQSEGLGIVEQKLKPEEMTNPKLGKFEYTMRAEDCQQIGRQTAYFSFQKMTDDHTYVQQFSTRDFYYDVLKNAFSDGIKEVRKDGSTYVWTFEDLLRLLQEFKESGESDFLVWFEEIKDQLSEDAAGNLMLLYQSLRDKTGKDSDFREFENDLSFMRRVFNESAERGVNIKWFGAKGDGQTDDTEAIQEAFDYAFEHKKSILVPDGTFLTSSISLKTNVNGTGTLKIIASDSYYNTLNIDNDGLTISGITIDGNRVQTGEGFDDYVGSVGLCARNRKNLTIKNLTIKNTMYMGMYFAECSMCEISKNTVFDVRGNFGDAIFFTGCTYMHVDGNKCSDYTRIGIVFEGNSTVKSKFNTIANNFCENGHDASILTGGKELNAGIWCENAHGNVIKNNKVKNQHHRGIVIVTMVAEGDLNEYVETVEKNEVIDCPLGFYFAGNMMGPLREKLQCYLNANFNVIAGEYSTGVQILGGAFKSIVINGFNFGNSETAGDLVKIDTKDFRIDPNIHLLNLTKGKIDKKNHINIIDNSQIFNLHLQNLKNGWKLITTDTSNSNFSTIAVENSELILTNNVCYVKMGIKISNSKLMIDGNAFFNECQTVHLKGCTIVPYQDWTTGRYLAVKSSRAAEIKIENCEVHAVAIFDYCDNNNHVFRVQGCNFRDYPASIGALLCNNCRLQVYETAFHTVSDKKPIIQAQSNINVIELRNVFSRWDNPLNIGLVATVNVGSAAIPALPI